MHSSLFTDGCAILAKLLEQHNRTQKSLDQDVKILEKWLENQPHLPQIFGPKTIQNFLIMNKFSIEKSKQKIDTYFTARTQLGDIYGEINPKLAHMKQLNDIMYVVVHPQIDDDLKRFCFLKLKNKGLVDKLEPCNILRLLINIQELRMRCDVTTGGNFVIDCADLPVSLALKVSPSLIFKTMVVIFEKVFSARFGGMYFLNFPPFFERLLQLAKKIMKPKLFKRLHVCSSVEELKQLLPLDFLPRDFGGEGPSCAELQDLLAEKFGEHQELFDSLDQIKVDENLRPGELKNDEMLGFYGNFKALDID